MESLGYCREYLPQIPPGRRARHGRLHLHGAASGGRIRKLPTFIHESNAIPGRANKMAAKFVSEVPRLASARARTHFPGKKCVVTGTPVRRDLGSPLDSRDRA